MKNQISNEAHQNLLKYAAANVKANQLAGEDGQESEDAKMEDASSQDEDSLINQIPIAKFKENQVTMVKGKMIKTKSFEEGKEDIDMKEAQLLEAVR